MHVEGRVKQNARHDCHSMVRSACLLSTGCSCAICVVHQENGTMTQPVGRQRQPLSSPGQYFYWVSFTTTGVMSSAVPLLVWIGEASADGGLPIIGSMVRCPSAISRTAMVKWLSSPSYSTRAGAP